VYIAFHLTVANCAWVC